MLLEPRLMHQCICMKESECHLLIHHKKKRSMTGCSYAAVQHVKGEQADLGARVSNSAGDLEVGVPDGHG